MKGKHCSNVVKASENVLLHQILSQKGSNPNEIKKKKKIKYFFGNCSNGIAENGEKNWMELWQCHCRKWEEKKMLLPKSGKKFKKKCYVHNIFIILSQQITGN